MIANLYASVKYSIWGNDQRPVQRLLRHGYAMYCTATADRRESKGAYRVQRNFYHSMIGVTNKSLRRKQTLFASYSFKYKFNFKRSIEVIREATWACPTRLFKWL